MDEANPLHTSSAPSGDRGCYSDEGDRFTVIEELCEAAREGDCKKLELIIKEIREKAPLQLEGLLYGLARDDLVEHASDQVASIASNRRKFFSHGLDALDPYIPLHAAAEFGRKESMELLLTNFSNGIRGLNLKNCIGQTALHMAATYGHNDCIKFLLKNGADPRLQDNQGNTPAHVATKERYCSCLRSLLNHCSIVDGDDVKPLISIENNEGDLPLHTAARWDSKLNCLECLIQEERKIAGHRKMSRKGGNMSKKGGLDGSGEKSRFINCRNKNGETPAHIAAAHDQMGALKILIDNQALFKDGMLSSEQRKHRNNLFLLSLIVFIPFWLAFLFVGYPVFEEEKVQEKAGKDYKGVMRTCNVALNEFWNCDCRYTYYMGLVLEPNIFILSGVFFFKLVQVVCEKQIIPALDFLRYYCYYSEPMQKGVAQVKKARKRGLISWLSKTNLKDDEEVNDSMRHETSDKFKHFLRNRESDMGSRPSDVWGFDQHQHEHQHQASNSVDDRPSLGEAAGGQLFARLSSPDLSSSHGHSHSHSHSSEGVDCDPSPADRTSITATATATATATVRQSFGGEPPHDVLFHKQSGLEVQTVLEKENEEGEDDEDKATEDHTSGADGGPERSTGTDLEEQRRDADASASADADDDTNADAGADADADADEDANADADAEAGAETEDSNNGENQMNHESQVQQRGRAPTRVNRRKAMVHSTEDVSPPLYHLFFKGDPQLKILMKWREDKYRTAMFSDKNFHGADFAMQPAYIFLYIQTLWSLISIFATFYYSRSKTQVGEWKIDRATYPYIKDDLPDLLYYCNFFGAVINSSTVNTVFSLFKMATFEGRLEQLTTAYRNLSPGLSFLWPIFILFPTLTVIPPFISHCIPGFLMYFWLFTPFALLWLIFRSMYGILYPEFSGRNDLLREQDQGQGQGQGQGGIGFLETLNYSTTRKWIIVGVLAGAVAGSILEAHEASGKADDGAKSFFVCIAGAVLGAICGYALSLFAPEPLEKILIQTGRALVVGLDRYFGIVLSEPLQRFIFWLMLEIFVRFMFLYIFQLSFDYATVAYLGHNLVINENNEGSRSYFKTFRRVFKWRSQPTCYFKQFSAKSSEIAWTEFFNFI